MYITYKLNSRINGNLILFKSFRTFFSKSIVEALHATKITQ